MFSLKFLSFVVASSLFLVACTPKNLGSSTQGQTSQSGTTIAEGSAAPDFALETFDGGSVSLASLRGKAVFLDFWAAWCPFCIEEMSEIEKISKEFSGDLVVWGIHRSETESTQTGERFAKERGVTYPLLKDSEGQVYKTYTGGRNFMPAAIFIDKNGQIIKLLYGPKTEEQMRKAVKEALGQTN